MSLTGTSTTVGTAVVTIRNSATDGSEWRDLVVQNSGTAAVLLGGTAVTSSAYGHSLASGAAISLSLGRTDDLCAVTAAGSATVRILQVGA